MGDEDDLRSRIEAQVLARRLRTAPVKHDRADHSAALTAGVVNAVLSPLDPVADVAEPATAAALDPHPPNPEPTTVSGQEANGHAVVNGHAAVNGVNGVNGFARIDDVPGTSPSIHDVGADSLEPAAVARRLAEAQARLATAESLLAEARRNQGPVEQSPLDHTRQPDTDREDHIARLIAALASAEAARLGEAARRLETEARAATLEQRLAVAEQIATWLEAVRAETERTAEIRRIGEVTLAPAGSNGHGELPSGYAQPPISAEWGADDDLLQSPAHSELQRSRSMGVVDPLHDPAPADARHRRSQGAARLGTGLAPSRVLRRTPKRFTQHTVLVRLGVVAVVAVIAAVLLRSYVVASYYIPSASMEPTLHGCSGCNNDHILVNKLSYTLHAVRRGDVIVFDRPAAAASVTQEKVLIKRVIGLPGDVLTDREGVVYLNGQALDEPYVNPACNGTQSFPALPVTVPKGDVYVMGDNRCDSLDSRTFGAVPESLIIGRAFMIIWPLGRLHYL